MPLTAGTRLNRYEITGLLGAGGMGEVYRAHDETLGRDVAIKVLPEAMSQDKTRLQRFEQEARAAAALSHPAILGVYEFGVHDGRAYMVTELLEGESLSTLLLEGPLPIGRALDFALQIARGLVAAHAKGIVHRDLKPENLFVTREGQIKILDFGLAKSTQTEELGSDLRAAIGLTETGAIVGTPGYLAPEQVRGGAVDARSDLFAFGAVFYEMVSGNRAFGGVSAGDRLAAVLRDEPSTVEMRVGAIPRGVDRIFRRCMRKNPADRFQRAQDLVAVLEAAIASAPEHPARRRLVAAALGVLALAAIAFALARTTSHDADGRDASPRSIAVLPFESLSGDPSRAWFADGVSSDVITRLSGLSGLERVIGWGSVKQLKGTSKSPAEIAKALNVNALVTGTVGESGQRVQLTVQLYDVAVGRLVWTGAFEQARKDLMALTRDVVRGLVEQAGVELTPQELVRLAGIREVNAAAYAEGVRAREASYEGTPASFEESFAHYQRAVELDPGYAAAWAGLADCYAMLGISGLDRPTAVFPKAKAAALRAVELDESSAEAHASLGQARLLWDWDLAAAESDLSQAVALGPNSLPAHIQRAFFLIAVGRYDEGLAEARRARDLDPIDFAAAFLVGWASINAQRFDDAIVALKRTLELGADAPFPHAQMAHAYARKGLKAEALAEFEATKTLSPPGTVLLYDSWLAPLYVLAGRRAEGLTLADAWAERAGTTFVDGYSLAALYAGLGEADKAVTWLQRAYDDHSPNMVFLEKDEWFAALRSDERVKELIRKVRSPI